jgi:hypothetical protein
MLRVVLMVLGITFIVGLYPLMKLWPAGWTWTPDQPEYQRMILAIYATLGVFLIRASRNPLAQLSLIWFTVWSSVKHALVMGVDAMRDAASGLSQYRVPRRPGAAPAHRRFARCCSDCPLAARRRRFITGRAWDHSY